MYFPLVLTIHLSWLCSENKCPKTTLPVGNLHWSARHSSSNALNSLYSNMPRFELHWIDVRSSTLLGKELGKKKRLRFLIVQDSYRQNPLKIFLIINLLQTWRALLWVHVIILEITEREKGNLWAAEAAAELSPRWQDGNHCSNFSAPGTNPNWWWVPLILQMMWSVTQSSAFLFYIICQNGSSSCWPGQKTSEKQQSSRNIRFFLCWPGLENPSNAKTFPNRRIQVGWTWGVWTHPFILGE